MLRLVAPSNRLADLATSANLRDPIRKRFQDITPNKYLAFQGTCIVPGPPKIIPGPIGPGLGVPSRYTNYATSPDQLNISERVPNPKGPGTAPLYRATRAP